MASCRNERDPMKVRIYVDKGESASDAKQLRDMIGELNFAPHVTVGIHYASEYGEAGHPPWTSTKL